jgi:hypothetical protein
LVGVEIEESHWMVDWGWFSLGLDVGLLNHTRKTFRHMRPLPYFVFPTLSLAPWDGRVGSPGKTAPHESRFHSVDPPPRPDRSACCCEISLAALSCGVPRNWLGPDGHLDVRRAPDAGG